MENKTVIELKAFAKQQGLKGYSRLNRKQDLVNLVRDKLQDAIDVIREENFNNVEPAQQVPSTWGHSNVVRKALNNHLKTYSIDLTDLSATDYEMLFKNSVLWERTSGFLRSELEEMRGLKFCLITTVEYLKGDADDCEKIIPFHRSTQYTIVNEERVNKYVKRACQQLITHIDQFQERGSGWIFQRVCRLDLDISRYSPLRGSSYIERPACIKTREGIINIQNEDQQCFKWCILAALYPQAIHPERVSKYKQYETELKFNDINFPVTIEQIPKFEKLNNISVNVYGLKEEVNKTKAEVYPLHITKQILSRHVNLLLVVQEDNSHYFLLKYFNTFMYCYSKHEHKKYFCYFCLQCFSTREVLTSHEVNCHMHKPQTVVLPDETNNVVKFKNHRNQMKLPFVIYADFECLTTKIKNCQRDAGVSWTEDYESHEPCGFKYVVVSELDQYNYSPPPYRGPDAVKKFLECLITDEKRIIDILSKPEPMIMTAEDTTNFTESTLCHICQKELNSNKVRDHCHLTGKYRGAAHNQCNINFHTKYMKIPVIFHNLSCYDGHLIMQKIGQFPDRELSCIPKNNEKYISFDWGKLRFMDSFHFLPDSL